MAAVAMLRRATAAAAAATGTPLGNLGARPETSGPVLGGRASTRLARPAHLEATQKGSAYQKTDIASKGLGYYPLVFARFWNDNINGSFTEFDNLSRHRCSLSGDGGRQLPAG
jgi:hypothetical protein